MTAHQLEDHSQNNHNQDWQINNKPLISLIVPAYNEAEIIQENLAILEEYLQSLAAEYRWEILVVNDGSRDETGQLAEAFASSRKNVRVLHHGINFGLGQALKFAFNHCHYGDYLVVFDLDLSYDPYHIGQLVATMRQTKARMVIASPYMKGGKISNVPWFRKTLSIWANRFLAVAVKGNFATLTGMVRAYDGKFLRSLKLRATGMEINPEVVHKAMLLNARIVEIPAHLHWRTRQPKTKGSQKTKAKRQSSMKILRHTMAVILSGFMFRPVMFFLIPSFILLLLSLYANVWVLIHCWRNYQLLAQTTFFPNLTDVVAAAFYESPHTFIIGGMTLIIAIQFFSLGILSLQTKTYFEEIFYLGTSIYKSTQENKEQK